MINILHKNLLLELNICHRLRYHYPITQYFWKLSWPTIPLTAVLRVDARTNSRYVKCFKNQLRDKGDLNTFSQVY